MDLCTGGELWEYLRAAVWEPPAGAAPPPADGRRPRKPRPLDEGTARRFAREMASAVRHLHDARPPALDRPEATRRRCARGFDASASTVRRALGESERLVRTVGRRRPDATGLARVDVRRRPETAVAGVCHRDLKPQNWLLARQPWAPLRLVDFGLARAFDRGGRPPPSANDDTPCCSLTTAAPRRRSARARSRSGAGTAARRAAARRRAGRRRRAAPPAPPGRADGAGPAPGEPP
ncbi:hypothetical protein JL720_13899 [Aureococcus anophagefferens]|nr:hypothetical protein JL720_13899 [Aureococcus anophagefferens]